MLPGKILKSGPDRVHFQHSGAKLECLNRTQTSLTLAFWGVISKEKWAVSSREIAGEFCLPPALIANPVGC